MLNKLNKNLFFASLLMVLMLAYSAVYANEMAQSMPDMPQSECTLMMDCGICAVPAETFAATPYRLTPSLDFVSVYTQQSPFSIHDRLYHPPR